MCGIIGNIGHAERLSENQLLAGLCAIAHRGPDDKGSQAIATSVPGLRVWFGHRRLSIIDLSAAGHQPMCDPATGNWITYNGEIYNYLEVRERLAHDGVQFRSHCDTEVILKAYARWGEKCVDQFRGMFAFAIWDARVEKLFAARDRLGIKPFYYFEDNGQLLFASEVRALTATGAVPRKLNAEALDDYLAFGSVYDPLTLIDGVRSLPAGHYLSWHEGRIDITRYWDVDRLAGEKLDAHDLQHALGRRLEEAVLCHTVSDVPVGIFLSGGVDSSSIVALLTRQGQKNLQTVSLTFSEQSLDEAEFSRAVATKFQTDHHEVLLSQQDVLESLPECLASMDQPTIDGINSYIVSRETRRLGLKVALSGLGSDEIFAGYSSFRTMPRLESAVQMLDRAPATLRKLLAKTLPSFAGTTDKRARLSDLLLGNGQGTPYLLGRGLFASSLRKSLLQRPWFREHRMPGTLASMMSHTRDMDPVSRTSYLELHNYMANTLLRDADFMSMAHSLEVRVPLIDHELVELVFAIDADRKLDEHKPKPLLVESVPELPPDAVYRPKKGFTLPFQYWLTETMRGEVEQVLLRDEALSDVLEPAGVAQVWRDFLAGRTSWSRPWSIYVLKKFAALHIA